jgi:hypothetical protein
MHTISTHFSIKTGYDKIIRELTETAHQALLAIKAQFLGSRKSRVLQLDAKFYVFK